MAKRGLRRLKIGVQSRFGPNSTVELEAIFRKNFGVAYCVLLSGIILAINKGFFGS